MCERLAKIVFAMIFAAIFSIDATAQGGEGRSDSVRIPSGSEDRRISRQPKRNLKSNRVSTPKVVLPETGRVAIRVNEGDSQLQIFRDGSDVPVETIDLPERSTSLIIRKLEVGSYTVAAKKAGFHDETRSVEIAKDQGRRVSIDLRPKMAILSVASNVPDAKISISNLGDFERPIEKALVKPGTYRVRVSRRGYLSRDFTVELKNAGTEEHLNVIIEPLRVDAVVDQAFEQIESGKLDEAEAFANDVLELNPQHARANLALGFVHLNRSESEKAVDRILQAVGSGEIFTLPVAVRAEPSDTKTVAAVFKLSSRAVYFESSERPGLNFSIPTAALERADVEAGSLLVAGRADYYGRLISARVQVYSDRLETLRLLLTEWRK